MSDKPEKPDESFLVCLPVAGTFGVVPGSLKKRCSACNCQIYVSPASWTLTQSRKLHLLCMNCARKRAAADDDLHIEIPTEEQRQELRAATNKDLTEEDWKDLQETIKKEFTQDEWKEIKDAAQKGISKEQWDRIQQSTQKEMTAEQLAELLTELRKRLIERN
jgi:hypothetical protein